MMRALWFVLAILVASFVPTTTRAQATVPRDEAYQHCVADMAKTQAFWAATGFAGTFGANTCSDATVPQGLYRCTASQTELAGMGRCVHDFIVGGANGCTSKACPTALHGDYPFGPCPSGTVWDTNSKTCFNPQRCLDKSALGNGLISGTATVGCIDGCEFAPPDGGKTLSFNGIVDDVFKIMWSDWDSAGSFPERRPVLAHYTSVPTLVQILSNDEFWLSHPLLMNDHQEMKWGLTEAQRLLAIHADGAEHCNDDEVPHDSLLEREGPRVAALPPLLCTVSISGPS